MQAPCLYFTVIMPFHAIFPDAFVPNAPLATPIAPIRLRLAHPSARRQFSLLAFSTSQSHIALRRAGGDSW